MDVEKFVKFNRIEPLTKELKSYDYEVKLVQITTGVLYVTNPSITNADSRENPWIAKYRLSKSGGVGLSTVDFKLIRYASRDYGMKVLFEEVNVDEAYILLFPRDVFTVLSNVVNSITRAHQDSVELLMEDVRFLSLHQNLGELNVNMSSLISEYAGMFGSNSVDVSPTEQYKLLSKIALKVEVVSKAVYWEGLIESEFTLDEGKTMHRSLEFICGFIRLYKDCENGVGHLCLD